MKPRPAIREVFRKKRHTQVLLIGGISTMLVAAWSMFEPGFHKSRELIMDFAQNSLPVHYSSEPSLMTVSEVKDVTLTGCWQRIQGDNDMNTGPGDYVPVRCSTNIYIDGEKVMLKVFYRIEEYGGDHTTYSGARTLVLFENTRPEYTIRTVGLRGSRLNSFIVNSEGANRDFRPFEVSDSYWEHLEYRVDSNEDDDQTVGIRGRLELSVVLESARSVRLSALRQI